MEITYERIKDIKFPIYEISRPKERPDFEDGLVLIGDQVLDDKNQKYPTLGERRLHSPHKLITLKRCIEGIKGLLQSKYKVFIDTEGKVFYYRKTETGKVKYFKIKQCKLKETYSILFLAMVPTPFVVPRPPCPSDRWAGVICINGCPWKLYDYAIEYQKPKTRMI